MPVRESRRLYQLLPDKSKTKDMMVAKRGPIRAFGRGRWRTGGNGQAHPPPDGGSLQAAPVNAMERER
jgi:hypothetical protein